MTPLVHGSGSGFVVGRLANGDYIVATAYHIAREAIERTHRAASCRVFRPESPPDLIVGVSRDGKHEAKDYIPVSGVQLLASLDRKVSVWTWPLTNKVYSVEGADAVI